MRRVMATSLAMVVVLVGGACAAGGGADVLPMGVSPAPSMPVDPGVTRHVCRDAQRAAAEASQFLDIQLGAIDTAAARGDQAAVVVAANAIQREFVHLAGSLRFWSYRPVTRRVRAALAQASAAVDAITAESYPGTQTDIARDLERLARALGTACL
jgi:hypothetical protein